MVFIVPKNRHPGSATAWLMLIMIFPSFGAILYAVLGNPKLPKLRLVSQTEVDEMTDKELVEIKESNAGVLKNRLNSDMQQIAKLATELGGLPPFTGNKCEIYTDYTEIINKQAEAIDGAKEYVHLEYFILSYDSETKKIFVALEKAVKRGVIVRVLFDGLVSRRYPKYKNTIRKLNSIGVLWHKTLPISLWPGKHYTRPDLRNHRKLLVIDGKVAFSGSSNIISRGYHRKDNLIYEETMLKMTGPIAWQFNNVFRSDWYAETKEPLLELVEDQDLPPEVGDSTVQLLPSGPSHHHENNLMVYTSLFHMAKDRISIVVPYFVPDDSVLSAIESAAKRGVKVTIINSEIIDKIMVGHAQRSYYEELLEVGVEIYLYKKPIFLHNKQVLIDNEVAVTGSSNLDIRSFVLDLELTIISYDKEIVKQLDSIESGYIRNSTKISKEFWEARPLRLKFLDRITRLTATLQ